MVDLIIYKALYFSKIINFRCSEVHVVILVIIEVSYFRALLLIDT